jgi:DNA-binding protein HU-beta
MMLPEAIPMAVKSPKSMTKPQLTALLADKLKTTKAAAMTFLDELAEIAIRETKKGGIFVLPGIGRLVKAHRSARMGRNPQNGQPLQIKAKTVVKFRMAKAAKDAIAPAKAA